MPEELQPVPANRTFASRTSGEDARFLAKGLPTLGKYLFQYTTRPTPYGSFEQQPSAPMVQLFIELDNNAIAKDAEAISGYGVAETIRKKILDELKAITELKPNPGVEFKDGGSSPNQFKINADLTTAQFNAVADALKEAVINKQMELTGAAKPLR